jgi:hypothetical protein
MSDSEDDLEEITKDKKKPNLSFEIKNISGVSVNENRKAEEKNLLGEEVSINFKYENKEKEYKFRMGHGVDFIMNELEKHFEIPTSKQELYFENKLVPSILTLRDLKGLKEKNEFNLTIKK